MMSSGQYFARRWVRRTAVSFNVSVKTQRRKPEDGVRHGKISPCRVLCKRQSARLAPVMPPSPLSLRQKLSDTLRINARSSQPIVQSLVQLSELTRTHDSAWPNLIAQVSLPWWFQREVLAIGVLVEKLAEIELRCVFVKVLEIIRTQRQTGALGRLKLACGEVLLAGITLMRGCDTLLFLRLLSRRWSGA